MEALDRDPLFDAVAEFCVCAGGFVQSHVADHFGISKRRAKVLFDAMRAEGVVPNKPPRRGRPPKPLPPAPVAPPLPPAVLPPATQPAKPGAPGNRSTNPRGVDAAKRKRMAAPFDEDDVPEIPDNILEYADLTLREVFERFGTVEAFNGVLMAVRRIEEIQDKRVRTAEREGGLVSRDLVRQGVIDPYNRAHLRLMTDGAKTITVDVLAKSKAGMNQMEIEQHVSELIGRFIKPIKNQIVRTLRDAED